MYLSANTVNSDLEKTDIIVQRIYQHYKGFSVVDEIRDQRIDGVSGGVSGMLDAMQDIGIKHPASWNDLLEDGLEDTPVEVPLSGMESVWIFTKESRSIFHFYRLAVHGS